MKSGFCVAGIAALSMAIWLPAGTASAQSGSDELALEEIIVTARKREESLQDIPIAINAFTAADILEGGVTGLEDISQLATGFYFFNQGQNQPGRYNTQLRFRGLNQAQFSPSYEAGALFIDGVYVLNGGTSLSLMDIERVEVIKGPQSAYFGRNTFGGAVNFITRDPDLEEFGGEVSLNLSERELVDFTGIIEGPIVPGKLSASLSGRYYDKEGHYTATDGGVLGNEETITVSGKLLFQPSDNFSVKVRASYSEDDDGAPAQGYVAGRLNDTCQGRDIVTRAGEIANPFNFICGQVPGVDDAIPAVGSSIIDGNTFFPGTIAPFYANQTLPNGVPTRSDIGLTRETTRLSLHASYSAADYGFDLIAGYNDQGANFNRDFDLSAFPGGYSGDPQSLEDTSFEFRVTSPQDGRFRWLAGVNYYEQEFTSSLQGGLFFFDCRATINGTTDSPCQIDPATGLRTTVGPFPNGFGQSDEAEVLGIFAAVDFDLTDAITLTLEGRYQQDTVIKGGVTDESGLAGTPTELEFDEFLPRAIVRFQPYESTTIFASYALGVIPGDLNIEFTNSDAQERAQFLAQFPTLGESTPQEELDSFEIGLKQSIFGDRGYLNLSFYWNEWIGIKGRSSVSVNETCTSADVTTGAPGCEYAGVIPDVSTKMVPAVGGGLEPLFNARNILLDGDADLFGWELEVGGIIHDGWTADIGIAYVDTEYTRYEFNFGTARLGFSDQRGNEIPRVPKWSGNFTSTYSFPITSDMSGFIRGDINYFGEAFTDERNLAFLEGYAITDIRGGIDTERYRLELYITNLFDEDAWASGARFSDTAFPVDFGNFFVEQGINVAPNDRRELGIRGTLRF